MADGAKLEYTVDLPAATGRFPVAMVYDGYCEGPGGLTCNDPYSAKALLAAGFAILGVSVRGTSCSTGTFDPFTAQEWSDGYAAVEWAAAQPWSNGHIGMFGDSFPGITQLGVVGLRPPHLDAIAPFQVTTDLYRDVSYPGGMSNIGFGALWAGVDQPLNSYRSGTQQALETKDLSCLLSEIGDIASIPGHNIALQGFFHPYDDAFWQARNPGANAAKIDIPTFGCVTWQDDEVGSRGAAYLSELDPAKTWVVGSNGYHGMCELTSPKITDELVGFFDRFVKGASNGFEQNTPHIQIWHDTHVSNGDNVPGWISSFPSYASMGVQPLPLYFGPGGTLSLPPPTGNPPARTYLYPGLGLGTEDGVIAGQHNLLWKTGEPVGGSLSYASPAFGQDIEFFGSGSANLWVRSTAPNTDLQVTITEDRPDGQEVYVTRGWLRASERALAPNSTVLAPDHPYQQADERPLVPGQPTAMRLQLEPFDYVFRKGSSIRVWIDAPIGLTGGWSLNFVAAPAVNGVYADAAHPSAVVLGYLPGGHSGAALPACDTLLNQPCRRSPG